MNNKPSMTRNIFCRVVATACLMWCGLAAQAQTTIYSDDFNRAVLGGAYTISPGAGNGTAFIVNSTTLVLTNGPLANAWVSVATNIPSGSDFNATLDSCSGLVTWTFNMRYGRTGGLPSGLTSGTYGAGYVLSANNQDFSTLGSKGYAILYGNGGTPDTFRLVAFTNGIRADYTATGSAVGNALITGTSAFATTTQAQANDYYSFKVTFDPATKIWTFYGRDDGSSAFADPTSEVSGSYTTIGTFTETTPIFRSTALGRTGPYWSHSTGANNTSQFDNFKLTVTGAGPYLVIDNTGTPATGTILNGTSDVPVFGFQLTPSSGSANFTGLKLTTSGTANISDLSSFRVVYDADNSGTFNGGDTVVSSSAQSLANPINFAITGQTGFSAARRYLVIANVAGGATAGHTFTASIAAGTDVTNSITGSGSAAGNPQTIVNPAFDLTMTAVAASESTTISSLVNDATITTTSQGVQAWQVTFNNPAGGANASTITAIAFSQGANNGVTGWTNKIRAAELFDGSTPLAAATISATNLVFSGLSVSIADTVTKTLSLRLSLATSGALKDNTSFQFAIVPTDVTVTGNGVASAAISSDQTLNKIDVVAIKLALLNVPTQVITNTPFSATVQAQDVNGNVDADIFSFVTISAASGGGTITGGDGKPLVNGTNTWPLLSYDTAGIFTIQAVGALTTATSGNITATTAPTLTDVLVPQYIQGIASGTSNSKRLPFAYRVTLGNLAANATYRYYNQCVIGTDTATATGAGNMIFATATGSFVQSSGGSLTSVGNYGTFTTDGSGSYSGWFISEPTGNGRFNTTNTAPVLMRIILNDGNNGTTAKTFLTTTAGASVLAFATTGANTGTAIRGSSSATDKNFVVLYDNTAGTGRPLAATVVEADGAAETAANNYAGFYSTSVNEVSGAWGTIIPNSNASGVQRIEQRKLSDGSLVAFSTDSDGVWPSGANTVNPAGGDATPIVITSTDAPLTGATTTTPVITGIQVTGGNVLIDFTGGTADGIGNFSIISTTDLTTPLVPISATITTSGPGVFRATIPVANPAAFYRIKR